MKIEVEVRDSELANEAPNNIEKYTKKKLLEAGIPADAGAALHKRRDEVSQKTIYTYIK